MKKVFINEYIVADSAICHGKPTFKGTRIMVWQILEMLATGESIATICRVFPTLTKKHIQAAFAYASTITREHYVILNTQHQLSY